MREFATKFFSFLSASTSERGIVIEPNPVRIMPGGLERIAPDGLALLGSNMLSERLNLGRKEEYMRPVSAEKLVYRII